ncbi:hypothetical protein [Bacillus coahuilensis]|uniref:hypothetical protein n=1 Tax=Bacillus coahuilensis TaxID=408580 RepID=UPI0001851508|nr:hypothetical protein [Bacillus coahuilensis]
MTLSVEEQITNSINKDTYRIYIHPKDLEVETNFSNQDLLSWLTKQTENFTIYKNIPQEASRLSFSNEKTSIYSVEQGAAYINVWNKDDQIVRNGKNYFYFNGREYEVAGYIDNYTNIIANLKTFLAESPDGAITGEYYLDAGEKSESIIHGLLTTIQKKECYY